MSRRIKGSAVRAAPPCTGMDIALVALLQRGGAEGMVDLEDIAVEAHRIMPEMFRWRRYAELPSYDATRVALSDAKKEKVGEPLVLYGGGHLRMLTAAGVRRAREVDQALRAGMISGGHVASRRPVARELDRVERHPAFIAYEQRGVGVLDRADLGDLLLCPTSAPADEFADRLRRLETLAVEFDRPLIATFCRECLDALVAVLTKGTQG